MIIFKTNNLISLYNIFLQLIVAIIFQELQTQHTKNNSFLENKTLHNVAHDGSNNIWLNVHFYFLSEKGSEEYNRIIVNVKQVRYVVLKGDHIPLSNAIYASQSKQIMPFL